MTIHCKRSLCMSDFQCHVPFVVSESTLLTESNLNFLNINFNQIILMLKKHHRFLMALRTCCSWAHAFFLTFLSLVPSLNPSALLALLFKVHICPTLCSLASLFNMHTFFVLFQHTQPLLLIHMYLPPNFELFDSMVSILTLNVFSSLSSRGIYYPRTLTTNHKL